MVKPSTYGQSRTERRVKAYSNRRSTQTVLWKVEDPSCTACDCVVTIHAADAIDNIPGVQFVYRLKDFSSTGRVTAADFDILTSEAKVYDANGDELVGYQTPFIYDAGV